MFFEAENRRLI